MKKAKRKVGSAILHREDGSQDVSGSMQKQGGEASLMDGIPRDMTELQCSITLQERAARVGFDWASPSPVLEKLQEETAELLEAMASGDQDHIEDELGDLLFVVTNLARQLQINPAKALRRANDKFEGRFRGMEQLAGSTQGLELMSLVDMEELWQQVKANSRRSD